MNKERNQTDSGRRRNQEHCSGRNKKSKRRSKHMSILGCQLWFVRSKILRSNAIKEH